MQFARMDSTLLKAPFTKSDIGKKIWLKFVSYNIFGAGNQDLSKVKAYQYTIQPYYIPPVTGISSYNRYRQQADGVSRYDIVVKWTPPALDSYLEGRVWYKTDHGQVDNLAAAEGVSVDSMGFSGEWIFGGSGKDQVVIPQAVVGDTYRICVTTVDEWGASTSPDLAPSKDIVVALKTYIPNTPDGFTVDFGTTALATWKEVTNTDISFYEIRLDNHPGVEGASLLARTNGLKASLALTSRTGTLYLYACNALGKYSDPATVKYSKALPPTPAVPKLTATIGGFGIMAGAIPNGCIGMAIYIDSQDVIKTPNNVYSCTCGAGVYAVRLAYYDLFGEGGKSDEALVTVKVEIDESMIKNEAISLDKVNAAIKDQLNKGVDAENKVSVVVDNLNAEDGYKNYSALTQLNDAINLRVKEGDVINQINVSPESILIDGSKVHITGETYFDDNIVTSKMLQAKAVTADKMSVDSLSAISANVGSLKGGTITGTQIVGTNFKNSSGSFTVDDSGNIFGATLKSGTIDGNTIRINGYNVRAVTILKGQLYMDDDHWDEPTYEDKHNGIGTMWSDGTWHHPDNTGGRYIPIPAGYDRSQCIWGVANAVTTYLAQNCYFPNPSIPYVECGGMGSGGWPDTNITYWCIGIK